MYTFQIELVVYIWHNNKEPVNINVKSSGEGGVRSASSSMSALLPPYSDLSWGDGVNATAAEKRVPARIQTIAAGLRRCSLTTAGPMRTVDVALAITFADAATAGVQLV